MNSSGGGAPVKITFVKLKMEPVVRNIANGSIPKSIVDIGGPPISGWQSSDSVTGNNGIHATEL